jgi:uncharacterized protein (TIGR03790 family)
MTPKRNRLDGAKWFGLLCLAWLITLGCGWAAAPLEDGSAVVVVYNQRMPESKAVAEHYALVRHVPDKQVFGFDLPETDTISRADYHNLLQRPLRAAIETNGLWTVGEDIHPATNGNPREVILRVTNSTIRYAVLCYGVPVRILHDPGLVEENINKVQAELRNNGAAVDSELAGLPIDERKQRLTGPRPNPFYGITNSALLSPTNGILQVTRLDGPSAVIAKGLVDKALIAETYGLWGRAYFDLRNITSGEYKTGDDWIRGAAETCQLSGFETIIDNEPATFPVWFPMSHIAFYAGWYDGGVSGPFTLPQVEFMPGAFAYHLHSYSAHNIRDGSQNWVGPLLAKGATITMGSVDEPYLFGTPDVAMFADRFISRAFSFGEAAYAGQTVLSWQTTVVGDPLYRPFRRSPLQLHQDLVRRASGFLDWSHLRAINLNLVQKKPPEKLIEYLDSLPNREKGAVLYEKLGDLYWKIGKQEAAADAYAEALKRDPSPQQKKRLMLTLADRETALSRTERAFDLYQDFLKENYDYPDQLTIYRKLLPLAEALKKSEAAGRYQREIDRLTKK